MENLNQTFDTLKRVNASLQKLNDASMRDYSITVDQLNVANESLKRLDHELRKYRFNYDILKEDEHLALVEIDKLRRRNEQLEQMLGAISAQCETELKNKDGYLTFLVEQNAALESGINAVRASLNNVCEKRDIELALLVAIIRGEI